MNLIQYKEMKGYLTVRTLQAYIKQTLQAHCLHHTS